MRKLGWHSEWVDRLFRLDQNSRLNQLEQAFKAIDGAGMAWLVHSDLAPAGQAKAGEPPPPLVGDVLGELDALCAKVSHGGLYVVAHEVQLVSGWTVGGVDGQLRGGQLEDQPPAAGVHMWLLQDVSEEGAVRFRIATEHDDMAAIDHVRRLRGGMARN